MNDPTVEDLKWLDQIMDRFESEWARGRQPAIEHYLQGVTGRRRRLLLYELVATDMERRSKLGDAVSQSQYVADHPELADELKSCFQKMESQADVPFARGNRSSTTTDRSRDPLADTDDFAAVKESADVEAAQELGEFQLIEQIARGGMGVVYKAWQVNLKRIVALKLILPGRLRSKADIQRFRIEAEAAARLSHPNILPIYTIGEVGGQHFFAMEYVEGQDLSRRTRQSLPDTRQAVSWIRKVAEAVQYAHSQGVVHRDIKPSNILVGHDNEPRVSDFGLARLTDTESELTETGQPMGSPGYMSPEQALGDHARVDRPTDIYSIGATLYHLLTGRPPFVGPSFAQFVRQISETSPDPPRRIVATVPKDLETICLKCLEKSPNARYVSCQELADDLTRWERGEPIRARPVSWLERSWRWCRRNPITTSLTTAIVLIAVIGLATTHWFRHEARQERNRAELADVKKSAAIDAADAERVRAAQADSKAKEERVRAEQEQRRAEEERQKKETQAYFHRIAQARERWEAGDVTAAEATLDLCPNSLRHWEWGHIKRLCHLEVRTFQECGSTSGVAFSPDGKWLASGGRGYTPSDADKLRIWNVETGDEIWSYQCIGDDKGTHQVLHQITFSHDGRILAVSAGGIRILDLEKRKEVIRIPAAGAFALSPDGQRIAATRSDSGNQLRIWHARTGDELQVLPDATVAGDYPLEYSRDGERILTTYHVYDAASGKEIAKPPGKGHFTAYSPDENLIVRAGRWSGTVQPITVYKTSSGEVVFSLPAKELKDITFNESGTRVAFTIGQVVRVFDTKTWQNVLTLRGFADSVYDAAFSPDDRWIGTVTRGALVQLWDATSDRMAPVVSDRVTGTSMSVSADGSRVATTSGVWDVEQAARVASFEGCGGVAFSPNGTLVATGAWSGPVVRDQPGKIKPASVVKIWDSSSSHPIATLTGHVDGITAVGFSRDGRLLASGSLDTTVKIWDVASGQEVRTLEPYNGPITSVEFSPDGKCLATGTLGREIRLWDYHTGAEVRTFHGPCRKAVYCPDGSRLAAADEDGIVTVWDAGDGARLFNIEGHRARVNAIAFSGDGRRIATAGMDDRILISDGMTGELIFTLDKHAESVADLAFGPENTPLFSRSKSGTLRLWHAPVEHSEESDPENPPQPSPHASTSRDDAANRRTPITRSLPPHRIPRRPPRKTYVPEKWLRPANGQVADMLSQWNVTAAQGDLIVRVANAANGVFFSPNGRQMAKPMSAALHLALWDTERGYCVSADSAPFERAVFNNDGSVIATSYGRSASVVLWNAKTGEETTTLKGHGTRLYDIAMNKEGSRVYAALDDSVSLWEIGPQREILQYEGHTEHVLCVAISPDGTRVASAGHDKEVHVWDAHSGQQQLVLKGHYGPILAVCFSPDGSRIASAAADFKLRTWDAMTGRELTKWPTPRWPHSEYRRVAIGFCDDSRSVAWATGWGVKGAWEIGLWDLANGKQIVTLHPDDVLGIAR